MFQKLIKISLFIYFSKVNKYLEPSGGRSWKFESPVSIKKMKNLGFWNNKR